jgi:hypothetical protein
MFNGASLDSNSGGHAHTGIMGDRHGIAAEEKAREVKREKELEKEKSQQDLERGSS